MFTETLFHDFFAAQNLAIFSLTFLFGIILALFLKSRGLLGCISSILIGAIVAMVVVALIRGYNSIIEVITYNLTLYIIYNTFGFFGFAAGFLIGLFVKRRR